MGAIIMAIVFFALAFLFVMATIVGIWTSCMPDEEREKWGLGPKGQGR